jgi:hypothetical protein
MTCPGSVTLSDGIPDVESSFAKEGTCAHHVGEQSLLLDVDPGYFLGEVYEGIRVDEDMVEAVQVYYRYIQERKKVKGFKRMIVEHRVNLAALEPPRPMFGTCDCVLIFENFIEIIDYKHGIGIVVEVIDNSQAMYYGLGFLLEGDLSICTTAPVVLTIAQPRIPHRDGLVRSDTLTGVDLIDWGMNVLLPAAQRTIDEPETYVPGAKQCRFCKAAPICEALKEYAVVTAYEDFGALPAPELLTVDEMAMILDRSETIKVWVNAIETHCHAEAEMGRVPPGYKLVQKRATKKWKPGHDTTYAIPMATLFGTDYRDITKCVTPAQFIKITGLDPSDHYEQESSGTNLIRVEDYGAPVIPAAADDFNVTEKP